MASLPLAALRLPQDTLALLSRLGLHRVGQLEALPRAALASRFGPQLLRRLDQMFDRAGEALLAPRAAVQFHAECSFDAPIEDQETVRTACRGLVRQIAPLLAARQEGVTQLECRLDCPPDPPATLLVGLFRPSASAEHLWQLLRLRLESLRLPGPVTAARLAVCGSAPLAWQQQELFATDRRLNFARQAAPLVDRLSNRLGRQAVVRPVSLPDAQPEHAWMRIPLEGGSSRNPVPAARRGKRPAGIRAAAENSFHPQQRPTLLKTQPLALSRVQMHGKQPRAFQLGGSKYLLQQTWGPERIETGWWRSGLIRRDYYRVETSAGSRFWIFQDLRSQTWFLHGEFA